MIIPVIEVLSSVQKMEAKSSLVLLNGDNYGTWKVQVKMCLIKEDLWRLVNGTETAPTDANALAKYNIRKDKALAVIVLAVDPKLLYLLGDPDCPVLVWKRLQDTYQKKTWANKLSLKKKLYRQQLAEGGDLQGHLKSMVEIFDSLAVVGDAINEEDRVICLLASLPEKYDTLVTTLETLDNVPGWGVVTERLLRLEEKHKDYVDGEKAYISRRYERHPSRCFKCGETGHFKKNCPLIKNRSNVSYAANMKKEEDEELVLAAGSASSMQVHQSDFLIDSAATEHVCNDFKMFENVKNTEEKNVLVGDGKSVRVDGKGDVLLSLDSGLGRAKRCRIKNVLYVPKMKYNLLSVSQLAKSGSSVIFYNNGCKLVNSQKTIAYGTKRGDLYVLARKEPLHRSYALSATCSAGNVSRRLIRCRNFKECQHFTCHA